MSTADQTTTRRAVLTGGGLVAFLSLAHGATDALTSTLAALLPTLQDRFGLAESTLALLVGTLAISTSVMQPLLGALSDRLGRHLVAALGIILTATLISLVGVAGTPMVLFGLLLFGGLGSAAIHPAGASIARAAGGDAPGLAVSLFGAGGTVGVALGPIAVLGLVGMFGVGATPWLMIPGVLLGLLMLVIVPPQERCAASGGCPRLFDRSLFRGRIGMLAASEIATSLAQITFASAVPLWLVAEHGVARDASLIGWTLSTFSLAAAAGGIAGGLLGTHLGRAAVAATAMALAPLPLLAIFFVQPGTPGFFLAVALAGALVNAGLPLKIVAAQELAPRAVATASGMLMGFAMGVAGLIYVGVGHLQQLVGVGPAMAASFLILVPGALLAWRGLAEHHAAELRDGERPARTSAGAAVAAGIGMACPCAGPLVADVATSTRDGRTSPTPLGCACGVGTDGSHVPSCASPSSAPRRATAA